MIRRWRKFNAAFLPSWLAGSACVAPASEPALRVCADPNYLPSTHAFVYRKDRHYPLHALDDPRLATLEIGVHVIGSDNPPPAVVLARRGITDNMTGYSICGHYRNPHPPAAPLNAVALGEVGVATAWGPTAAFLVQRTLELLEIVLVDQPADATWPTQFSIASAERRNEPDLRRRLDEIMQQRRQQIDALLRGDDVSVVANANWAESAGTLQ